MPAFLFLASVPFLALGACSSGDPATPPMDPDAAFGNGNTNNNNNDDFLPSGDGGADGDARVKRVRLDGALHPDASCGVTIETPILLAHPHVAFGTDVTYNSNPPSSGPHYPIWAAYQSFAKAVDRRYYVHDLEHGALVFVYKCDKPDGCPEIASELQKAADAIPNDALCDGTGVRVRAVITPDPLLDVPIAAASWGWTYKAQCLDLPTLKDFAVKHYGQGTETSCENGQTSF